MSSEEFTKLVASCADDDALIAKMKEHIEQKKK
jgi:hypothetical protein